MTLTLILATKINEIVKTKLRKETLNPLPLIEAIQAQKESPHSQKKKHPRRSPGQLTSTIYKFQTKFIQKQSLSQNPVRQILSLQSNFTKLIISKLNPTPSKKMQLFQTGQGHYSNQRGEIQFFSRLYFPTTFIQLSSTSLRVKKPRHLKPGSRKEKEGKEY